MKLGVVTFCVKSLRKSIGRSILQMKDFEFRHQMRSLIFIGDWS